MSTVLTSSQSSSKDYTPHPAGSFMAVCADVFTKEMPNKYKGQIDGRGKMDNRDTITKVCIAFLTDELMDINGEMVPRYASYWGTATLGTVDYPSNVRKFIKAWWPSLTDAKLETLDMDNFIGKGAYLTITNSTDKTGKVWANVIAAAQPPKGATVPLIPAEFVRHKDKDVQANGTQAAPVTKDEEDDGLPF